VSIDPLNEEFSTFALGFVPYGGAEVGEVQALVKEVGDGDEEAFYEAWRHAGDRFAERADEAEKKGHTQTARDNYLRASCHYSIAYKPIYGKPVDPRLVETFKLEIGTLDKALALGDPPIEPLSIPYQGTQMPGYLIPAKGDPNRRAPLLIATNGYDATVSAMYFCVGQAAAERGYHCLIFDGPGQGKLLIEEGITMTGAWEEVVTPVVDFALGLDNVDPDKIALTGWSLGGYLAPRAASGEHRLAACIADPALAGIMDGLKLRATSFGASQEQADALPDADDETIAKLEEGLTSNISGQWSVVKRGYWVNGGDDFASWLKAIADYSMEGRYEDIQCPTLLTYAENDPLGRGAPDFYDQLRCEKKLVKFLAADGAGDHCEMLNRPLLNRVVFDWLDEVLGPVS
jgi:alpha-beta hydrolase superfamily lysophospholipase